MNERQARAVLFSAIEGGHPFWAQEIFRLGAIKVIAKLHNGGYDVIKFEKLIHLTATTTCDQVLSAIESTKSHLIVPGDAMWPKGRPRPRGR